MENIKIFVDTGADMPVEIREKYNIGIINFLCTFGDKSYVAEEEISNSEFYEKLAEFDQIPKTSQTPPGVMCDILSEAAKQYKTVLYFCLSSKASGQYGNALMNIDLIKEENPAADVRVIDTFNFSAYISEYVIRFCELLEAGEDIDTAIEKAKEMFSRYEAFLLVDSLKYLEKGGRITKTKAIVGELLDIKPVLSIRNGLVEPIDKLRGKKKVIKKLVELISEQPDFDEKAKEFIIVESNKEYAEEAEAMLCEKFGDIKIMRRYEFGPIVGTHTGANTIAILYRRK